MLCVFLLAALLVIINKWWWWWFLWFCWVPFSASGMASSL